MKIHDQIAAVVTSSVGMTLSTGQVQALVLQKYPDTNPTSIIPSDHSGSTQRAFLLSLLWKIFSDIHAR
jgi:hypothetical protein